MKIAIDGPAGSGKTTLGRALARRFGLRFIETGKMYRAAALGVERGLPLESIRLAVTGDERFLLDGDDVTERLHTPELDRGSSEIATRPDVRRRLVVLQRQLAEETGVVMEGRDIGTVVLPDATVKIFLQASPETRAQRRVAQRPGADYEQTLREIRVRDERDSTRAIAPLNAASDATIIDTDRKSLAEVISQAIDLVEERLKTR